MKIMTVLCSLLVSIMMFSPPASGAPARGLHGSLRTVSSGSVVKQDLAKQLSDNRNRTFWWFCGQASTATAINFVRNSSPTDATKIGQLQWFHDRLKARESTYSVIDPVGPYAARIDWLYNLMLKEKSSEFAVAWLTSSNRETVKASMMQALDSGAYVVALNQTSGGVGHYLTVYAIDYQPTAAGGGTVYYGDVLLNRLGTAQFKVFLDRMFSQSAYGLYNAFSVKKK